MQQFFNKYKKKIAEYEVPYNAIVKEKKEAWEED